MKKLLKTVLISVSALLVFVLLALLLLTTAPGENLVKGWLEGRLSAEIGLPIRIAKFETDLWSHVQVDTITASAVSDSGGEPILYVGRIRVGYSIPQLLGEMVILKSLSVDSVALGVTLDSLGRFGVPFLDNPTTATADTGEPAGVVSIESLSLSRMGLFYSDAHLPLSVELDGAVLSAQGDRDGRYSGRLTAGSLKAVYDSLILNFGNIEVAASLDSETLRLDHARVDCEGLHLEAQGDIDIAESKNNALTMSVDGSLATLAPTLAAAFDLPPLKAGEVSAQCRFEGAFDDPDIRLHADVSDLIYQSVAVQSAMVQARYHDESLLVDIFRISTSGGTINGDAGLSLDSLGAVTLNLALDRIELASLWQAIYAETSPYQGRLKGRIGAHGQGADLVSWTVDAVVAGDHLHYLNRPVPDLQCSVTSQSGRTRFAFVHGADEIHAEIDFAADSLRGEFDLSIPDITALSRFVDQPDLSGGLWAKGMVEGAYSNPAVRAAVNGSRIVYRNFPVDSVFAELSYEDSSLTLIALTCDGTLDSIDPQQPPFGIDSVAGSVAYRCRARGPLSNLTIDLLAHLGRPQYGSYAVDSLSLEATLSGTQVTVKELEASRGGLGARLRASYDTATTSGSFDLLLHPVLVQSDSSAEQARDTMEVRADFGSAGGEFALGSHADLVASVHGQGLWLGLLEIITGDTTLTDGEIDFDLTIDGPYLTPTASLKATARAVEVSDYHIDSISTQVRLAQDTLILDNLTSFTLGHTLQASGQLGLSVSPDGLLEVGDSALVVAELSTTDFNLSALEKLALPNGEISGLVSARLSLNGSIAAPRLHGWLTATSGRLLLDESSLPLEDIVLSLSLADSVLTIDSVISTVSGRVIEATGSLTSANYEAASVSLKVGVDKLGKLAIDGTVSETRVDLEVLSDSLNLTVFQPFVTKLDSLAGRLSCRLVIMGPPAAPSVDGSLQISALSFKAPRHNAKLSEGHADVRFDRNRFILDSAVCSLNGGRVTASGVMSHDQGKLLDIGLTLQANAIVLHKPETYTVAIDSAMLSYGKRQDNYVLDGDIVLGEARLTAGLRATSILPWVTSIETVDLELPELIARSRLDVRVRESDNLWVDNNLARVRLHAEVGVIGTPLRPNFTGMIRFEEGYLLYLDRRFLVNEGSVYFNDPARFNPDITLDASTEVTVYRRTVAEPYTIFIKAEGLLDQLQYGLYSEPPLEKPDIVALLTLGATRTELAGGNDNNGGLTGVLKDRAAMLTSRRVSGYLSRRAGSLFGFDEFTIKGNLFQFDETWGPQLVASKRLSRRVDFTYSTTVGQLNDQAVRLGYRLTPRFSLQGETDRQGRSGLDLKYGFRFK